MWAFDSIARTEQRFSKWYALVTLDDNGVPESFFLKFPTQPSNADITAAAASLVASKNAAAADAEFEAALVTGVVTLKYQTAGQFRTRVRQAYLNSTAERTALIAYWMIERINDGTFTDNQVQNAFNLTSGQYTTLKAQLQTLHDQYVSVTTAQGQ